MVQPARGASIYVLVALTALAVGLTLALRLALNPVLGAQTEFIVFLVPVLLAARLGGVSFGLSTTLACLLLANAVLVAPTQPGAVLQVENLAKSMVFLLVGGSITYMGAQLEEARERAEASALSLRASVAELETLMDLAPIPIFIARDPECNHITGNRAAAQLLESTPQDNLTATGPVSGPPAQFRWRRDGQDVPPSELPMQCAARGMEVHETGLDVIFDSGLVKHIIGSAAPLADASGRVVGSIGAFTDITELKRIQDALRGSEERFRVALRNAPILVYHCDRELRYTWIYNPHPAFDVSQVLGRRDDEVPGRPPEYAEMMAFKRDVLNSGVSSRREITLTVDGDPRVYDITADLLYGDDGEPTGLTVAAMDVTDYKRAEDALRQADQAKDEFLAMLGHELRNPLNAISNAAELLTIRLEGESRVQRPLDTLRRQVRHMARMVDDLLDVSRITRGRLELRLEDVDLVNVARRASDAMLPSIENLDHMFEVTLPDEPLPIRGDAARLEQVIGNLLSNASKYTPNGGLVALTVEREDARAVVRVKDNGDGISREMLPRIFDLFAQEDRSLDRARGGLGIGLTVVKRLVEMHGGTVESHSDGPGTGCEFIVRLPIDAASTPEVSYIVDTAGTAPPRRADRGLAILLVEDSHDAAQVLADTLRARGHTVETVQDGPSALDFVTRVRPQVVLLDIGLPGMDGFEVARRMRADPSLDGLRIIAVTGYGQDEDLLRSEHSGIDAHLIKPVNLDTLECMLADQGAQWRTRSPDGTETRDIDASGGPG